MPQRARSRGPSPFTTDQEAHESGRTARPVPRAPERHGAVRPGGAVRDTSPARRGAAAARSASGRQVAKGAVCASLRPGASAPCAGPAGPGVSDRLCRSDPGEGRCPSRSPEYLAQEEEQGFGGGWRFRMVLRARPGRPAGAGIVRPVRSGAVPGCRVGRADPSRAGGAAPGAFCGARRMSPEHRGFPVGGRFEAVSRFRDTTSAMMRIGSLVVVSMAAGKVGIHSMAPMPPGRRQVPAPVKGSARTPVPPRTWPCRRASCRAPS